MRRFLPIVFVLLCLQTLGAEQSVYKVALIRAAPGRLLPLIELLKEDIQKHETYGIRKPYLMRHSQGDQWDLLFILPLGSLETYFDEQVVAQRRASHSFDQPYGDSFYDDIAHHEELFVSGPPFETFTRAIETFDYYHVEMFVALPGKQAELLKQREMENVYLNGISRDPNLIFTKVAGSRWDCFTIGFYRDIKHFAESADIPADLEEKAAIQAGFKGANTIGSYLRELISEHHDTLAGAVR